MPESSHNRPRLERQHRPAQLPLSYEQLAIWIHDRVRGESTVYNSVGCWRLTGRVERGVLQRTINTIIERHESLRTHFEDTFESPHQVVESAGSVEIPFESLNALDKAARHRQINRALEKERNTPFDLSRGPLIRVGLFSLSDEEAILLRTVHHIAWDGVSRAIFDKEFGCLYEAYRSGRDNPLTPVALQYADYTLWHNRFVDTILSDSMKYWYKQLDGISASVRLPTDRPRQVCQTFDVSLYQSTLSSEQISGLAELARNNQASLYMTLLAGFAVLLSYYTGQTDITVASPVANRQDRRTEHIIGIVTNTIIMRIQLDLLMTISELIRHVRQTALDAYYYQDTPFDYLLHAVAAREGYNSSALCRVMFSMPAAGRISPPISTLAVTYIQPQDIKSPFELEVRIMQYDGNATVSWQYNKQLFDLARIQRMAAEYLFILKAIVANARQAIGEIVLI